MTPWVKRLIISNVGIFFLQVTDQPIINAIAFAMTLRPYQLITHPWTLVTYQFLHSGAMHLFFNMLSLYFFGPQVEARMGSRRFITLYLFSGIIGGLCSFIFARNAPVVGASGAIFGVMLAFAQFWPDAEIILWFFPMPARLAVLVMAALSLWNGMDMRSGIAGFAHLGGFLGGWIYLTWLQRRQGAKRFRQKTVTRVANDGLANYKQIDTKSIHEVNRDEVNRILDKISAKGLGSLTQEERLFLSNFVPADDRGLKS